MRRPSAHLRRFLGAYDPKIARLFFAAREAVLGAAPDANELVYDAYNAVSAAYSFSDRLKEAFCHVAAYSGYVNLGFNRGATLPDPERLLVGTGANIRHIRIATAEDLQAAAVKRLVRAAVEQGRQWASGTSSGKSVVRAVCAKKRRPAPSAKG